MSRNSARTNKPDPFGQSCLIDFRGSVQGQFRPGSAGVPPLPPQCPQNTLQVICSQQQQSQSLQPRKNNPRLSTVVGEVETRQEFVRNKIAKDESRIEYDRMRR